MVHGSVGMNVVSAIVSLAGVLLLLVDLIRNPAIDVKTVSGGLLPFVLLEFCLTCVVSHFGCQATCWNQFVNRTEVPTIVIANPANTPTGPFNATYSTTGHVNVITSSANPTSPTNAAAMVPPVPS